MASKQTLTDGREAAPGAVNDLVGPEAKRCNVTALRKATRRVSQLYDTVLAPCGLRSTQRAILMHIASAGIPTMGDLAMALVLDRSALAHNLKPLERDGLVKLIVDRNDKRSRLVQLTARGEEKLRQSFDLWKKAQHGFETAFGAEQARGLRASLALISSAEFAQLLGDVISN
jgi:DNA-binding MarR family transcriptional regulator